MENTKNIILIDYTLSSLTLQYMPSDQQELAFHFTKSLSPGLHPTKLVYKPDRSPDLRAGNPLLRPEVTNRPRSTIFYQEKSSNWTGIFISIPRKSLSPWSRYSQKTTPNVLSYANGNMENKVGLDINLSGTPTSWITITPSISLVHSHTNGNFRINLHVDDFSLVGDLEPTLNSKHATEFQALFSYQSPTKVPQFKVEENYYLDLAIKQGF